MSLIQLAWALGQARTQTLELVSDVPAERISEQSSPREQHPAWVLGHLLLADSYLLFLMGVDPLPSDFKDQLATYGPGAVPSPDAARYDAKDDLVRRLTETNVRRLDGVQRLTPEEFDQALTDSVLVDAQPTLGHHLHSQLFHEGYHNGQLAAWRRARGLPPVWWAFGPR
jgi:hypothetical protein